MRWLALWLLLLTAPAFADSNVTLSWTPPTTWTDGTPITVPMTFNVYRYGVQISTGLTGMSTVLVGEPRGQQCYTVRAVASGIESLDSNIACKYVTFQGPTDGAIE